MRINHTAGLALLAVFGACLGVATVLFVKRNVTHYLEGDYSEYYKNGGRVVLLGTSTCPFCERSREHLHARGVAFRDLNITDAEGLRAFAKLDADAVPVILIGERMIQGYYPEDIDDALEAAEIPTQSKD